jgi:hypothetical protein
MMNDVKAFMAFCNENPDKSGIGKVDYTVQLFPSGYWPQSQILSEINFPPFMQRCFRCIEDYYDIKTKRRCLQWTQPFVDLLTAFCCVNERD